MRSLHTLAPVVALSSWWRLTKPRPDADVAARALVKALERGQSLGEALTTSSAQLAQVAVSEGARVFQRGPVALFIVDVRDALRRQLRVAGRLAKDLPMRLSLERVAQRVNDDCFVQHLINTVLEETQLYTEAMPLEVLPEARISRAVEALFARALSTLVSPNDRARRLGERTQAIEFALAPRREET